MQRTHHVALLFSLEDTVSFIFRRKSEFTWLDHRTSVHFKWSLLHKRWHVMFLLKPYFTKCICKEAFQRARTVFRSISNPKHQFQIALRNVIVKLLNHSCMKYFTVWWTSSHLFTWYTPSQITLLNNLVFTYSSVLSITKYCIASIPSQVLNVLQASNSEWVYSCFSWFQLLMCCFCALFN